jgi:hypothetical protein
VNLFQGGTDDSFNHDRRYLAAEFPGQQKRANRLDFRRQLATPHHCSEFYFLF